MSPQFWPPARNAKVASGRVTGVNSSATTPIYFPVGLFTEPPNVVGSSVGNTSQGSPFFGAVTKDGTNVAIPVGAATATVDWVAVGV